MRVVRQWSLTRCAGVKRWDAGGGARAVAMIATLVTLALIGCHRTASPIDTAPEEMRPEVPAQAPRAQNDDVMPSDPFARFRSVVAEHFAPLAAEFALGAGEEKTIHPETYIEFHGGSARLGVGYEMESRPWVYVVITTAGGHERHFGLHSIVEQREGTQRSFDELENVLDLEAYTRGLADLTRRHAGSLLTERTANLRQLYLLSEKALREREQETGFPPTLDVRPTLPQLFEACEPADRAVCAYHAIVDYQYSTEDVAAFLTVRGEDVQRMVDQHDTIR